MRPQTSTGPTPEPKKNIWHALRWSEFLAEFLGVALIVYTGGYVVLQLDAENANSTDVALTHGIILGVLIYIFGRYYVPQFNPAITITAWIIRRQNWLVTLFFVISQLLGSIVGASILKGLSSTVLQTAATSKSILGFPQVMADSTVGNTIFNEILYTFVFTTLFLIVTSDRRLTANVLFLALGGVVALSIFAAAPNNVTALNPARVFGPALITKTWTNQWVFYVGPFSGALVAGLIYWWASKKFTKPQVPAEGDTEERQGFISGITAALAKPEIKVDYNTFTHRPLFA